MTRGTQRSNIVYWDASAVLSALFKDEHSATAWKLAREDGIHLLSSLAAAEVHAVIARIEREAVLADVLIAAARDAFASGPWRPLHMQPSWRLFQECAVRWPLRGTDLWHLALAKTVRQELPEVRLLTFDRRLAVAAAGEKLMDEPL